MFFPWHAFAMLAFESNSVIALRLAKIGRGGSQSLDEIRLMFAEKASASMEATAALLTGGTVCGTVDRYREHVAANEARLSA